MIIECHDKLGKPRRLKATRVVVYADNGTPIALSFKVDENHNFSCHAKDPEFTEALRLLGVGSTVLVVEADV